MAIVETDHFLPNCFQLLSQKDVKFKVLSGGVLSQTPSSRLHWGAYVFPGSKSPLNPVLFISDGEFHKEMFLVAYSKLLTFKEYEYERLLFQAADLNSMETLATWKIERKNGLIFPLLEMTLFPLPAESVTPDLIWRGCGAIDSLFKAKGEEFKGNVEPQDVAVQKQVRTFLEYMGFKKIKDQPISGGISYLVVLSNDDDTDESIWKRFPLKIEVTDLIIYRIYFSIKDAAVTSRKGFVNSSKVLMAQINKDLPMGHYNYVSGTKQVQLVFKMQYKAMSPSDIWQSLRVYYDTIIQFYKWTAPGFVQLYLDVIDHTKSVSEMQEYLEKVSDEIQGETLIKVLDYTHQSDLYKTDVQLLSRLQDPSLSRYLLPYPPVYRENKVQITTRRSLLPFLGYFERLPYTRDRLIDEIVKLFDLLRPLGVFPTIEMLFCSPPPFFGLFIIPGKGLHQDAENYLDQVMNFSLGEYADFTATITRTLKTDFLKQNWSDFQIDPRANLDEGFLQGRIGGNVCFLYRHSQGRFTMQKLMLLDQYISQLGQLPDYPNVIIGWTEATIDDIEALKLSIGFRRQLEYVSQERDTDRQTQLLGTSAQIEIFETEKIEAEREYSVEEITESNIDMVSRFLVEKCIYSLWQSESFEQDVLKVAKLTLELHHIGFFHWFLSPFTIRQHTETRELTLVLPCLKSSYFDFIYSFVPERFREFLAPEVRDIPRTGKTVKDGKKADVYSLCKVIVWHYSKDASQSRPVLIPSNLHSLVAHGLETNPEARPTLEQVFIELSEILVRG